MDRIGVHSKGDLAMPPSPPWPARPAPAAAARAAFNLYIESAFASTEAGPGCRRGAGRGAGHGGWWAAGTTLRFGALVQADCFDLDRLAFGSVIDSRA